MKSFILACLLVVVWAENLSDVLKSPQATLNLYTDFKSKQHLSFSAGEDQIRFRLFRSNAKFVAAENELHDGATYELNFFSSMTPEEKQAYLGLNITGHLPNSNRGARSFPTNLQAPVSKLWMNYGAVTAVKNQGKCGSCWTFGAVGAVETFYKQRAGVLRSFAEQEYLDCVKPFNIGCRGGWPSDCFNYSKKYKRLAATADYPYRAADGSCLRGSKPNGLVAATITGFNTVPTTEAANIQAMTYGALAVAFQVTTKTQHYKNGIMRDTTCHGRPNHAVTAVGYTPKYILVKNSWGKVWGDNGYIKFARNYHNCELYKYSSYPLMKTTGTKDTKPADKATDYKPSDDPNPNPDPNPTDSPRPTPKPDCRDTAIYCNPWSSCMFNWTADQCKKTCKKC